jgi:hypothetical protein
VTHHGSESPAVLARLRRVLREEFALEHVTLQIEAAPGEPAPADPACVPCDDQPERVERVERLERRAERG